VLGSAPATSERSTLSLHDALPIFAGPLCRKQRGPARAGPYTSRDALVARGFPGAPRPRTDSFPGCFVRDRVPGLAQVAFDHRPVLAGEFRPGRVEDRLEHGGQGGRVVHWHRQAKGGWAGPRKAGQERTISPEDDRGAERSGDWVGRRGSPGGEQTCSASAAKVPRSGPTVHPFPPVRVTAGVEGPGPGGRVRGSAKRGCPGAWPRAT